MSIIPTIFVNYIRIIKDAPKEFRGVFLKRCLAESNRCSRFCRPVPNRSAKAPLFVECKDNAFSFIRKYFFLKTVVKCVAILALRSGYSFKISKFVDYTV